MNGDVIRRARWTVVIGFGLAVASAACSSNESTAAGSTSTTSAGAGGTVASSSSAGGSTSVGVGGATGSGGAATASSTTGSGGTTTVGAGGAGGATTGAGGSAMGMYLACAQQNCPTETTACLADTACACVANCINGGTAEGSCKQTCSLDPQNAAWAALVACTDAHQC